MLYQANLLSFVQSLPDGLNTHIGENGQLLSGGQKQRVAIARAFYFKRHFLILDEPTSALDEFSQAQIIKELVAQKESITILLVTHNLELIKYCDAVYEISENKFRLL